jgi:hypothetical protein
MASKPDVKREFNKSAAKIALVAAFDSENAADIVTQLRSIDKNDATSKMRGTINDKMATMLNKHDNYALFIDVVAKAKKSDIKVSVAPLTEYMEKLLKNDDHKTFLDVYEKGQKAGVKLLTRSMKNMLKGDLEALVAAGNDQKFFDLHEKLRASGIKIVSSKISTHMTAKLAELAGEGKYKEFFKLYDRMLSGNIKPDKKLLAEAVESRMKHHLVEGEYDQFFELHTDLRQARIKFDKTSIAAAVEGRLMEHIKAGDHLATKDSKFFDLYAQAKEAGIKPDMTYVQEKLNAQLAQFVKDGNSTGFRDLLEQTAQNRIKTVLSFVEIPADFDLKGTNLRYTNISDVNTLCRIFNETDAKLSMKQKFEAQAVNAVDAVIDTTKHVVATIGQKARNVLEPAA